MKADQLLFTIRRHSSELALSYRLANPTFRYATIAVLAGYLLSLIGSIRELLVLTPNNLFNFHLWRLFTCPLAEPNPLLLVASIAALYQFTVHIEPVWSPLESLKFFAIVYVGATLAIAWFAFLAFALLQQLDLFFYVPICGLNACTVAVLMALKQSLPDSVLVATPYGRLKNGHLPLTATGLSLLLWVFGIVRGTVPLQALFSLQLSWTYLRYFQIQPHGGGEGAVVAGDRSEHFTWASLFPRRVQPFATLVGRATFRSLVAMHVCKRLRPQLLAEMEELECAEAAVLPMESRDAERRRQKALRMLNERLSSVVVVPDRSNEAMGTLRTPIVGMISSSSMPSISPPSYDMQAATMAAGEELIASRGNTTA